jgi:hypothetical protein
LAGVVTVTRQQVLGHRVRAQQLDRDRTTVDEAAVLDIGVQDSGPDGAPWALAVRGVDVASLPEDELAMAWTIRGAPHVYRRSDLPAVAAAAEPFSEADAGKRIYDASKPLKAAGIGNLEALDAVAAAMRSVVTKPMVKGDVSSRVTAMVEPPFLRSCRPCDAVHLYEMPFRLAALRAGLELEAGTSPPVLRRIAGFERSATVPEQLDVVRCYLRLLGPATPRHVATYLDAPVADVKARWPDDALAVSVEGETRWVLGVEAADLAADPPATLRLLGPFDLFLQARDRELLVADAARSKALWPVLGRPGGILVDGEVAGTWRPRKAGSSLRIQVEPWVRSTAGLRDRIGEQAQRLAAHRGLRLAGVEEG